MVRCIETCDARIAAAALLSGLLIGCAGPCSDDGLFQDDVSDCPADESDGSTTSPINNETDAPGDQCGDGVQNGDETDVDCGGAACNGCGDGQGCENNDDCGSGTCSDGVCTSSSCSDGAQNGDETDVDCGGPDCEPCGDGSSCDDASDCESGECDPDTGVCSPSPSCEDGMQNGEETDIDCGGPACETCDDGQTCVDDTDCTSGTCDPDRNTCSPGSTCEDGTQNGEETDVDCGGPDCDACGDGGGCSDASDCSSGVCDPKTGTCSTASCDDGVQNGNETGVDCGGADCDACGDGEGCTDASDCASGVCDPDTNVCVPATCTDGVLNGNETDVDCGGPDCGPCDDGEMCMEGTDCVSEVCAPDSSTCTPAACDDGVQNGAETDVDCGGPDCGPCDDGEMCMGNADCTSGVCDMDSNTCSPPACDDGVQNGDETDVDCGGTCGATCEVGEGCEDNDDCVTAACDPMSLECVTPVSVDAAPVCSNFTGDPVPLTATASGGVGGYSYAWTPAASLDDATSATPNASPSGYESYEVTVSDGITQAVDTAVVVNANNFNLEDNCTLYVLDNPAGGAAPAIGFSDGGTRACLLNNANDTGLILCEGVVFENVALEADIQVGPTGDDDVVGLVWGAQDASNFYVLSWWGGGNGANPNIIVKRVFSDDLIVDAGTVDGPTDTAESEVLFTLDAPPWVNLVEYHVTVDFTSTGSHVNIVRNSDNVEIADFDVDDTTYQSGFYGIHARSQDDGCLFNVSASCL